MALAPVILRTIKMYPSHFVEYLYPCTKEPLVFFWWVLVQICEFLFSMHISSVLVNKKWQKNGFSSIYMKEYHTPISSLILQIMFYHRSYGIFLVEYWPRYANLHFSMHVFSVQAIIKYQKNGFRFTYMNNYPIYPLLNCRVLVSQSHREFNICFG